MKHVLFEFTGKFWVFTVCTPVYQLEECCIKHPHVLLQDQTNVNIWTCMRYCKDPKTGRWVTVKKVCVQCLGEMDGEDEYEKWYCKLVQCVELPEFLLNEEEFESITVPQVSRRSWCIICLILD